MILVETEANTKELLRRLRDHSSSYTTIGTNSATSWSSSYLLRDYESTNPSSAQPDVPLHTP
jgi:hypothetical protein